MKTKIIITGEIWSSYTLRKALRENSIKEMQRYNTLMLEYETKELAQKALTNAFNSLSVSDPSKGLFKTETTLSFHKSTAQIYGI